MPTRSLPPHESHQNVGVGPSNRNKQHYIESSSLEVIVNDISSTHSKGYFRHLPILNFTKGRMLVAKPWKPNLYNGISLHHNNVACNHSIVVGNGVEVFVHNDFAYFLSSISASAGKFLSFDSQGRVFGMTPFLQQICLQVLDAVQYISSKGIVHNNLASLDSIVFSRDETSMVYDFSHSYTTGSDGYVVDVKGLGGLLDNLFSQCGICQSMLPLEIRHLLHLLKNINSSVSITTLKDHPAFVSPEQRRVHIFSASCKLKDDAWATDWRTYVNTASPSPSLTHWRFRAQSCPDWNIKQRAHSKQYQDLADHLIRFMRDTYEHYNDNFQHADLDDRLATFFLDISPNLFVEWFCFENQIDDSLSAYSPAKIVSGTFIIQRYLYLQICFSLSAE